ncbi:MAG: D-tyrosyl-tRNA(Tyr) deacylase [Proteobacteria bacterium]|nr:D-tyrosyl-tRNA(Tyr) deacylase [Pseudomonadota bacterium]
MRAVVQRVSSARAEVDGEAVGAIDGGFLVLLGVARGDGEGEAVWLAEKVAGMRVFEDEAGKMNLSLQDTGGSVLVVSQFTLLGDCRRGRRPSFGEAAPPEEADRLYRRFVARLREVGLKVETGVFQAHMAVSLVNDGPVTLVVETPEG